MPPWPAENSYSVKERRLYSHATLTSREQLMSETNKAVLTCHLDQQSTATESRNMAVLTCHSDLQRTLNERNKAILTGHFDHHLRFAVSCCTLGLVGKRLDQHALICTAQRTHWWSTCPWTGDSITQNFALFWLWFIICTHSTDLNRCMFSLAGRSILVRVSTETLQNHSYDC